MIIKSKRLAAKLNRKPRPATLSPEALAYLGALKRRNASPRTIRSYRLELLRMEQRMGVPMVKATHRDLDGYLSWLAERGVRAVTLNKSLNVARSWSRWALTQDVIAVDPTRKLELAREEKRLPKRPTDEDLARLLEHLAGDTTWRGRRNQAMIACCYYLGARASEVVGLDVAHVDFGTGRVRLFGKGRKERYVPMVPALAAILSAWLEVRPGDGPLFGHRGGERLSYDGLRHTFNTAILRAGLAGRGYTLHKLRHAFATRSLRGGMPLDKIQKLLGHSSVATTQIYAATEIGPEVGDVLAVAL